MRIIIDGYNLIRQSEEFRRYERRGLEQGRKYLIGRLAFFARTRRHSITVVFDGWEGGSVSEERSREGAIGIIFSRIGEKADDVIRRLTREGGRGIMIVTSDRELAHSVTLSGADVISSRQFEALLEEEDPSRIATLKGEAAEACPAYGTKKKGPSRKMPKNKRAVLNKIKRL